jgi:hypothetical protein
MIQGRIVRIFDELTVAINQGADAGVEPGMEFAIYTPYEQILDPETGQDLGRTRRRKAVVVATNVHQLFTIATAPKRLVRTGLPTGIAALSSSEERQDPLPVARSDIQPYDTGTQIRVGDNVEQIERRPSTSKKASTREQPDSTSG